MFEIMYLRFYSTWNWNSEKENPVFLRDSSISTAHGDAQESNECLNDWHQCTLTAINRSQVGKPISMSHEHNYICISL